MPKVRGIIRFMLRRSTIICSLSSLFLLIGCDTPLKTEPLLPDSGSSVQGNPTPNPLITETSEDPPGAVEMNPPTAADADAKQQLKLISHGMNVGNFLDGQPLETSWTGASLHGWYFQAIKEAGFDHVRIPVRWNIHAGAAPDYTIDATFMARVDWAVAHTLTRGMAAVLDIHHYDEYYKNPAAEHDKFIALWKQIAQHYQNYPKQLIFELLNEPQGSVSAATWNADLTAAASEIRVTNPNRTLMVGGVNYNNYSQLTGNLVTFPAGDKNVIATYHYYNPYCFTIPPQTWDCPVNHRVGTQVVKWPVLFPDDFPGDAGAAEADSNEASIDNAFSQVSAWSQASGIPVYVGEFGADTVNRDVKSRAAYIGFIVQESEKYGFGWANWSFISTFAAWNGTVGWYPEVIQALTGYVPPAN